MSQWPTVRDGGSPPHRVEMKYLIGENTARRLRDFVGAHLVPDAHAVGQPGGLYPVHSLYLDSADLRTYHAVLNGTRNRFKLRLRYYDDRDDTPVFLEVKARLDRRIQKYRCAVRRQAVSLLLGGQLPQPEHLFSDDSRQVAALERFNRLRQQIQASPRAHTCYRREAWVSPRGGSVRVTLDRDIYIDTYRQPATPVAMAHPVAVFPGAVVLELKFTERFPAWLNEMVQRFGLMPSAAAKYCAGMSRLAELRGGGLEWTGHSRLEPATRPTGTLAAGRHSWPARRIL